MPDPDWVTIAILGKPRGNRGELTALSLSDHPERFEDLKQIHLFGDGAVYNIEEVWYHQATLIFKFAGVNSISDAKVLTGAEVRVPFAERAPLDPGEFYHSDLIGCQVHDRATNRIIGSVTGFEDGGASGLLKLGAQILIPFTKAICVHIDPAAKWIEVDLPEGLVELN